MRGRYNRQLSASNIFKPQSCRIILPTLAICLIIGIITRFTSTSTTFPKKGHGNEYYSVTASSILKYPMYSSDDPSQSCKCSKTSTVTEITKQSPPADETAEEALVRAISYLLKRTVPCADKAILGGWVSENRTWGDPKQPEGSWPVCADSFKNRIGSCLVYSFGINNDFSFDDEVAQKYGCNVYAFDPSMNTASHQRSPRVMYWNVGVAAETGQNKIGWNVSSVKDLMKLHGHKRIDILKMDVEGDEWPVLEELIKKSPEVLWASDQLNLEFHFELERMVYQANLIRNLLVEFGYHVWNWHVNPSGKVFKTDAMKPMVLHPFFEISLMRVYS